MCLVQVFEQCKLYEKYSIYGPTKPTVRITCCWNFPHRKIMPDQEVRTGKNECLYTVAAGKLCSENWIFLTWLPNASHWTAVCRCLLLLRSTTVVALFLVYIVQVYYEHAVHTKTVIPWHLCSHIYLDESFENEYKQEACEIHVMPNSILCTLFFCYYRIRNHLTSNSNWYALTVKCFIGQLQLIEISIICAL